MSEALPRDKGERVASPRRIRLVKIVFWLLLIPLLFFALSNLWLGSSWGTGIAEEKLKERTGMDWEVQGMTWSPWAGFTVRGATMLQPEELRDQIGQPLLAVDQINVQPYWGKLIRGDVRLREVTMDSPQVTVSVEMLAALLADTVEKKTAPPQPAPPVKKPPVVEKQPEQEGQPPKPKKIEPAKKKTTTVAKEQPKPERPPARPAMRVLVKNASVRVFSATRNIELLDSSGIDLDLPIFGEDSKGVIKLGELRLTGIQPIHDVEQKLVWKRPYLEMEEQTLDLGGIKVRCIAQLGVLRGLPFLFDLAIDPQQVEHVDLLNRLALDVRTDRLVGRTKVSGQLISPMSWRASMLVMSDGLSVLERHGGHQLHFDELSVPAVFHHGTFQWSSARVIGEDISFLGNGHASLSVGINSVTRLVASPELSSTLHEAMRGAKLVGNKGWWENLETPDRKFRDIHVTGSLINPSIDLGEQHDDVPLWKTLSAVLRFIRLEMKEEGVTLQPILNQNPNNPKHHENH